MGTMYSAASGLRLHLWLSPGNNPMAPCYNTKSMGTMVSLLLSIWFSVFPPPVITEGGLGVSSVIDPATDGEETGRHGREAMLFPRGIESMVAGPASRDRRPLISIPEWLDSFLDRAPSLRGTGLSLRLDRRSFVLGYSLELSI